jgi:hypothetical protein
VARAVPSAPEIVASVQQPTSPPKRAAAAGSSAAGAPTTSTARHAKSGAPVATAGAGAGDPLAPVEEKTQTSTLNGSPGPPAQTGGIAGPSEPTAPAPEATTPPAPTTTSGPPATATQTPPLNDPAPAAPEDGDVAAAGTGGAVAHP